MSDRSGTIATPLAVIVRTGNQLDDHAAIAKLAAEEEVEVIVVGLPLSLDGTIGLAAQGAIDEAAALATVVAVPVETFDERLTTVTAERNLIEMRMRREARRRVIDKVAAAVMLQSWIESRAAL